MLDVPESGRGFIAHNHMFVCMYHSLLLRLSDAACLHCAASNSVEVWDICSGLRLRKFRLQIPEETDMYVSAGVMHDKQVKCPAALTLYSMQTVATVSHPPAI